MGLDILFFGFIIAWLCLMVAWGFMYGRANHKTGKKRHELIDRWTNTGDFNLACDEFNRVSYDAHFKEVLWFRNPRKLYGPLLQDVWDQDYPQTRGPSIGEEDRFWRCYKEIYLGIFLAKTPFLEEELRDFLCRHGNAGLEVGMIALGLPPSEYLGEAPPKFAMLDGAEEYDQIMAAQESMTCT